MASSRLALDELAYDTLDLLVDAECPFSGMWRTLLRMSLLAPTDAEVRRLWECVTRLDDQGMIRLLDMQPDGAFTALGAADRAGRMADYARWLPASDPSELSVDKVGVWLEILPAGRLAWIVRYSEPGPAEEHWMFDVDAESRTLTIFAASQDALAVATEQWERFMPRARIAEPSIVDRAGVDYVRRDGAVVRGGVSRTARYEDAPG